MRAHWPQGYGIRGVLAMEQHGTMAKDLCHLESERGRDRLRHPRCVLQRLNTNDLGVGMCEVPSDEEVSEQLLDQRTYQLHAQFVRAHGRPSGEVTTMHVRDVASVRSIVHASRS